MTSATMESTPALTAKLSGITPRLRWRETSLRGRSGLTVQALGAIGGRIK
jgi:hypothetical protein